MTVIKTQRLVLRPWEEADATTLYPLASDVDVPLLGERRDEVVNRLDLTDNPDGGRVEHTAEGVAAKESPVACALAVLAAQPNAARYLSITEPLRLGRVAVRAVGEDLGVLVRFKRNGAYFAAPIDEAAARVMAGIVPDGSLVSLADDRYLGIFTEGAEEAAVDPGRYELWAYEGDASPVATGAISLPKGFTIAPLAPSDVDVVDAHYALLSRAGIKDHLKRGWIWGGFDATGALVGFIGEHDEASMGMLEVFPEARRRGYAQALEAALIDRFLQEGRTPYCHVAPDNEASRALQQKLGLRCVDTIQCWFTLPGGHVEGGEQ